MKKFIFSIITLFITSHAVATAQDAAKKDFLFLGGNVGLTTPTGAGDANPQLIAGLEALYMRKVWGKFSLGGGVSYGLGLPSKENFSSQEYNGAPAHDVNITRWNNDLTISFLAGTIAERADGSRFIFVAGPTVGTSSVRVTTKRDFHDAELSSNLNSMRLQKRTDDDHYFGGRLGVYFQPANTNWTYGVNGIYGIGSDGSGGPESYFSAKVSVGYAF